MAALHQGAPGQMTWLEGWPTWLAPWLKNMSVKTQLLCFSNSVKKYCKCYHISSIHSFYFECNNRRCQLASYIIAWRSLVNYAHLFTDWLMRWIKHVIAILVSNLLSVFNSFIKKLSVSCWMRWKYQIVFLSSFNFRELLCRRDRSIQRPRTLGRWVETGTDPPNCAWICFCKSLINNFVASLLERPTSKWSDILATKTPTKFWLRTFPDHFMTL